MPHASTAIFCFQVAANAETRTLERLNCNVCVSALCVLANKKSPSQRTLSAPIRKGKTPFHPLALFCFVLSIFRWIRVLFRRRSIIAERKNLSSPQGQEVFRRIDRTPSDSKKAQKSRVSLQGKTRPKIPLKHFCKLFGRTYFFAQFT